MIRTLRSEFIKFRTITMNWVLGIVAMAFPLAITLLTAWFQGDNADFTGRNLVEVLSGTSYVTVLLVSALFGMLVNVFNAPDIVLFVRVSIPAKVAKVPVAGKVTLVAPVAVNVNAYAPAVVNEPAVEILPPRVIVFEPLLTPVPPYVPVKIVPFQVPVVIVPRVVIDD